MGQNITSTMHKEASHNKSQLKLVRNILVFALVICGVFSTLFFLLQYNHYNSQNQLQRDQHQALLHSLINVSEHSLQQLFGIVTSLQGMHEAIASEKTEQLKKAFNMHWDNMKFEWNLDRVEFFTASGNAIAEWSARPSDSSLQSQILQWVEQHNDSSKPIHVISCVQTCSQYLIDSININEQKKVTLVIAISLLDILHQFEKNTGLDIGIFRPAQNREASTDMLVYKWGYEIYSITNAAHNNDVLHEFANEFKPVSKLQQSFSTNINDQHYELTLYPLIDSEESMIFVLKNHTQRLNKIIQNTQIFAALIFFSLLALPLILRQYITNLFSQKHVGLDSLPRASSQTLPLAQDIDFNPSPSGITSMTDTPVDFDLTSESVLSITDRLDSLKKYNQDINLELAHQMVTLSQERDLMRVILDNTQAIILTQKEDGTISSMNKFGELITGYNSSEIKGKNFIDLYPEKVPFALNNLQTMSAIANGSKEYYRHEARMSCKDGQERVILWLHSRLGNELNQESPLLSAGLDITEHKQLEKNLSWLADHDSLTSLYNRRRFEEELEDALNWANTHKAQGALMYIDLDNFKDINDSCGHQVGDTILRKVANTLQMITRDIDSSAHIITSRLGGDEFSIILRNIDNEGVSILCQRILESLYQIQHNEDNFRFQLTCSIGVALFPGSETNSNELLSNADSAMYHAKMLGRNQYYLFHADDSHREQTHHRMIWREKIEYALENGRFILHYQPILNIQTRTISHYETLIRMLDENDELIAPGVFINYAERLGMIQDVDNFILKSAISKQAQLMRQGHDITLAINLSAKVFDNPKLTKNIKKYIDKYHARAENLIFEITETAAVSDIVAAEKLMQQIQNLGCQFALDDFGVGFSSFYYLRELPVEYVKIDGSFVNDLPHNTDNQILVKALSEVAIGFNKLSVAEFVDSLQTLHILNEAKVNFAQGYFIGKPSEKIPVDPPNFYQASVNENTAIL